MAKIAGIDIAFNERLCAIVGTEPNDTTAISIRAKAGEVTTITIERVVNDVEWEGLRHLITEYGLHELRAMADGLEVL